MKKFDAFMFGVGGAFAALLAVFFVWFVISSSYHNGWHDAERCLRYQIGCYKVRDVVAD